MLTIDRRAVLALPSERPQQVKVLEKAYEWLTDPELYARAQSDRPAVARLSSNDIDKLLSTGKIEKVPSGRENTPLGQCSVHKVLELLKKRWRVVQHPKDVNAYTPDADKVQFMKFLERHKAVHAGTYALDLDFVSFFDAFELDPEVRRYFCFTFNGQQYRMCVMPMGAKQSVKVAHETTVQLLNFPSDAYKEPYVDNARFVADSAKAAVDAAIEFVLRCAKANAKINEIDITLVQAASSISEKRAVARSLLEPLVVQQHDWLGERYDYVKKTVCLAEKTKKKITECLSGGKRTFKNLAAIFAILQYASRTLGIKLAKYFTALRAQSTIGRFLSEVPELWPATAPELCPAVEFSLHDWQRDILEASPRRVNPDDMPTAFLICDTSAAGWGAAFVDPDGHADSARGTWGANEYDELVRRKSAWAEPVGIRRALNKFITRDGPELRLVIGTDSSTARYAFAAGHSKSWQVNGVCDEINKHFKRVTVETFHIPGKIMPVDGISRNENKITIQEWEQIKELALLAQEGDIDGVRVDLNGVYAYSGDGECRAHRPLLSFMAR